MVLQVCHLVQDDAIVAEADERRHRRRSRSGPRRPTSVRPEQIPSRPSRAIIVQNGPGGTHGKDVGGAVAQRQRDRRVCRWPCVQLTPS